jgi:hypothetical protein
LVSKMLASKAKLWIRCVIIQPWLYEDLWTWQKGSSHGSLHNV